MNEHCQCSGEAGFCPRHNMIKGIREKQLCKGTANIPDSGKKYWIAWENGQLGATKPPDPILNPDGFNTRPIGIGSVAAKVIDTVTLGLLAGCTGCQGREAVLNHILPIGVSPPVETMQSIGKKNLLMHVYPRKKFGIWQWNLDQIRKRIDLFDGRRIIAIVHDSQSDRPEAVKDYVKDVIDEFIVMPNIPVKREGVTFIPLFEKLVEKHSTDDVTFFCHSKGVRHDIPVDQPGSTLIDWTSAMYETLLDYWPKVESLLLTKAAVGSFRRFNNFHTRKNNVWHYSGTFRWSRDFDFFNRNWRYMDSQFFAAESHIGHMYKSDECACMFADNCDDLYLYDYWKNVIKPQLEAWRKENATFRTVENIRACSNVG